MYQGCRKALRGLIALFIIAGLSWLSVGCSVRQARQDIGARSTAETTTPPADTFEAQVVDVTDGDTIKVSHQAERLTLRLARIDAPERTQAYGEQASDFLSAQTLNQTLIVQITEKDRYGRWLAEVYLLNGHNLNQMLVATGNAWWYREYAPNDKILEILQNEARQGMRGLWSQEDPTPPWRFRQKH